MTLKKKTGHAAPIFTVAAHHGATHRDIQNQPTPTANSMGTNGPERVHFLCPTHRGNTLNESSSGGIGFAGLLTIVFIVLKLTNVIAWSWWWVLSPLWISFGLALLILGVIGLVMWIGGRK